MRSVTTPAAYHSTVRLLTGLCVRSPVRCPRLMPTPSPSASSSGTPGQSGEYLYRLTRNPAVAEDLAQEVFLRVVRSSAGYEAREREAPWVFRIAQNVLRDFQRRRVRSVEHPVAADAATAPDQVLGLDLASGARPAAGGRAGGDPAWRGRRIDLCRDSQTPPASPWRRSDRASNVRVRPFVLI